MRYNVTKPVAVFAKITSPIKPHYRIAVFNMNIEKEATELFYCQDEDLFRLVNGTCKEKSRNAIR